MLLGRLFNTLSYHVETLRKKWAESNPARLKYEPLWILRLVDDACDRPAVWTIWVLVAFIAASIASGIWQPPYPGLLEFTPNDKGFKPEAAFLGVWAVQTAIVALVYPIVVAFVTVLIQRQQGSKASLQAYYTASASKLTGLSSLGLVVLMALQFPFIEHLPPMVGFAWLVADVVWLAVNVLLSIYFLAATFEFASPEGRVRARNRYILTRGWPAEWTFHISRLLSTSPIEHKLINVPSAWDSLDSVEPAMAVPIMRLADKPSYYFKFRGEKTVVGMRYLFVQLAFWLWKRSATKSVTSLAAASTHRMPFTRRGPVLEISLAFGDEFACSQAPVWTTKGPALSRLEKALFWFAFSLSTKNNAPRVTVSDALEEARADAASAITHDASAEFELKLEELLELYDNVVEASHHVNSGVVDNWVLLPNSRHPFRQLLVQTWIKVFLDLNRTALSAMTVRSDFSKDTVRIGKRCLLRQSGFSHVELQKHHVTLQYSLLRQLLDWGAENCAVQEAGPIPGLILPEPLRRRYEEVLKSGVSAWESVKNDGLSPDRDDDVTWSELQSIVLPLTQHLGYSARLVMSTLITDDRRGYQYFTDSLLKWFSQLERYHHGYGVAWDDRFRVNIEHTLKPYEDFRRLFPLPDYETENWESLLEVWLLALKNYWRDVLLTLMASAVIRYGKLENPPSLIPSLVANTLYGDLIFFDSASATQGRPFDSADKVLASLIRQLIESDGNRDGYRERMDHVAESLADSPLAEGIAGRMYSGTGTDVDSLRDGYLLILAFLVLDEWEPAAVFDQLFRTWGQEDEKRRRFSSELASWIERLFREDLSTRYANLWEKTTSTHPPRPLSERLAVVRQGLERLRARLNQVRSDDLRGLAPSPIALTELARHASLALNREKLLVPLSFFASVAVVERVVPQGASTKSFNITGYDKGRLTDPPMSDIAINEEESIAQVTGQALAIEALQETLRAAEPSIQEINSSDQFVEVLTRFGVEEKNAGREPVLIVASRTDPSWLTELARGHTYGDSKAIVFRRIKEFSKQKGYAGHIGDTAIFTGPVPRGEGLLCAKSLFGSLELFSSNGLPIQVTPTTEQDDYRCTLSFSWQQKIEYGRGPAIRLQYRNSNVARGSMPNTLPIEE